MGIKTYMEEEQEPAARADFSLLGGGTGVCQSPLEPGRVR